MMKLSKVQLFTLILCAIPFLISVFGFFSGNLTSNPVQAVTLRTGRVAVILLMLSLACTPAHNLFGSTIFQKVRKILGLFSFFYAFLHFLIFIALDFEFNSSWIIAEFMSKPFLQVGLAALIILLFLALTSMKNIQKKMGIRWNILQRLTYFASFMVLIHYYMAAKGDKLIPLIFAAIFTLLMIMRISPFNKIKVQSRYTWIKKIDNRFK